jgi:succinylglutamate desuccinylase
MAVSTETAVSMLSSSGGLAELDRSSLGNYPIEVMPPLLNGLKQGNAGTDYVHRLDSGFTGPCVMLNALTHGNEYSGAIGLMELLSSGIKPLKGQWIISFANIAAFQQFDTRHPDRSRFIDTDMNRVWSAEKIGDSTLGYESLRAAELVPFLRSADFVLDLHSMHEACEPLLLSGLSDKAFQFAQQVGTPRAIIRDAGHADGTRLIDFEVFADESSPKIALLLESGQHWSSNAVEATRHTLYRFLLTTETISGQHVPEQYRHPLKRQLPVKVVSRAVASTSHVRFTKDWRGMEIIKDAGTIVAYDADIAVRTPFDHCVLIMPSLRQVRPGVTFVRFGRECT